MCGIIGFVGDRQAAPIVLGALERLEYRGYDSAGVATRVDGQLFVRKDVGKLAEVAQRQSLSSLPGEVGIGHVRWATHGAVTQANAHPHIDCKQQIAVVHNGIIENCQELRSRLEPGHKFISETDTEVIAHLIEEHTEAGVSLEKAVLQTLRELKGSYALAVISAREPQKVIAARRDSPLVIGIGSGGNFVASDALCFLEHTNQVVFVEDGEVAVVTADRVCLFDTDGKEVRREVTTVDWKWDAAAKHGHDFFMLKEILEQPEANCFRLK